MTAAGWSRCAAVAGAITLAAPTGPASASPAAEDPPAVPHAAREQAKVLVERGARAYEDGDYEAALAAFQDAAATYASPDFHFNIGLCQERLGEYGAATRSFEAYLRNQPDAPDRATVERRIELLRELATREAAAGEPASPTAAENDDAMSTGVASMSRSPTPPTALPDRGGAAQPRGDVPPPKRHPGRAATATGATFLGIGAGLAIGGGVAFDIVARRRARRVDEVLEGENPDDLTYAQTRELAREADRFRGLQIGAIAVGVTLAAIGLGLLVAGRRRAAAPRSRVAFTPVGISAMRVSW